MDWDIKTGNSVFDNLFRKAITDDVFGWALVTYFEKKGLLNREEFFETMNEEANYILRAIQRAEEDAD